MSAVASHHDLLDRLATDPAQWNGAARIGVLSEIERLRRWLAGREADVLSVVRAERDDVDAGAKDLAQLCQQRAHVGFGEAKRRELRAMWLAQLPVASAALVSGEIGIEHIDAVCLLADRLDPDERPGLYAAEAKLVEALVEMTPPAAKKHLLQFEHDLADDDGERKLEKQRRANALRLPKNGDGTIGVHGQLDPIAGAKLRRAIDATVTEMWRREHQASRSGEAPPESVMTNDRRRAEALVELIRTSTSGSDSSATTGAQVLVLIDHRTLLGQPNSGDGTCRLGDGTPIPAAEARLLACQAGIIPVVLGSPSQPLDIGRLTRLATGAQRAALRAIHDTCSVGGCDAPFEFCQIHHIDWWRNGGPTDLANLTPLCSKHHHLAHSGHWRLQVDAARTTMLVPAAAIDTASGVPASPTPTPSAVREEPSQPRTRDQPPPARNQQPLCEGVRDRRPRPDDAHVPMRC